MTSGERRKKGKFSLKKVRKWLGKKDIWINCVYITVIISIHSHVGSGKSLRPFWMTNKWGLPRERKSFTVPTLRSLCINVPLKEETVFFCEFSRISRSWKQVFRAAKWEIRAKRCASPSFSIISVWLSASCSLPHLSRWVSHKPILFLLSQKRFWSQYHPIPSLRLFCLGLDGFMEHIYDYRVPYQNQWNYFLSAVLFAFGSIKIII